MWLARHKDGSLLLFENKPEWMYVREEWGKHWTWITDEGGGYIDEKTFPQVTFENSPQEVSVALKSETTPIENWILKDIVSVLHASIVSFLGITAIDSSEEQERKSRENETCVVRSLKRCLRTLKESGAIND